MSITRKEEPYFYVSTVLKEEPVVATAAEEYQPAFSPDGKEVAYLENRQTLKVMDLATNNREQSWVPIRITLMPTGTNIISGRPMANGFWCSMACLTAFKRPRVGLVAADGKSEVHNLTQSGYDDVQPKWAMDGKMMIWGSTRDGALAQGGGSVSDDVYGMYFSKALFEPFKN